MAATASIRWGAFRAIGRAMRSASAPGAPGMATRLAAVPRMALAVLRGRYAGLEVRHLLLSLAAVGYVVSPVDLMPEALLAVAGLGDDALVIGWLAVNLVNATDDFLEWERHRAKTVPSEVIN